MNYDEFEDRLGDSDLSAVFRFWRIRCGQGVSPTKSAFYPDRLPFGIWPNLYLYERTDNGRILGVLSGTSLVRHFGCDATGRYLDEDPISADVKERVRLMEGVLESERPVFFRADLPAQEEKYHSCSRLVLPLRDNNANVRYLFGIVTFSPELWEYEAPRRPGTRDVIWADAPSLEDAGESENSGPSATREAG